MQLIDSERRPNMKKYLKSIRKFKSNNRANKALKFTLKIRNITKNTNLHQYYLNQPNVLIPNRSFDFESNKLN